DEAAKSFARAISLQPDYPLAAANLAEVQRDLGEVERAEATLRAALARQTGQPPFRPLVVLLAGLCRERGAIDEAEKLYQQASELSPGESAGPWLTLGWVRAERGEPAAAREAYGKARAVDASDLRSLFAQHLTLPMIYGDEQALLAARGDFTAGLGALELELPRAVKGLREAVVLD